MATFVNDLRLTELATGEGSGTWGTTTNTNLELIGEAFSFGTEAITTNADTHTTTIADGSTDPGRSLFLKYTGTLDSACTITIAPNTVSKLWFIENATSGSQNIIIKQGSGATITIPNGQTKAIYSDGAGSGGAMVDAFQDLSIPDLFVDDDLTIGDDLVFSSDSAVITFGADGDTTLTHTDGSGLTLNSTNKIMFNDASQFIQGSSATVLSLGATDEIDLTATLIDINGNADVSGTVTATGTSVFASLDISGDIDVDGTTNLDVVDIDGAVDMASTLTVGGVVTAAGLAAESNASSSVPTLTLKDTDTTISVGQSLGRLSFSSADSSPDAAGERAFIRGYLIDGTNYGVDIGSMASGGSPASVLTVSGSGNVGIATNSPAAPLSIEGSSTGEFDALILRNSNAASSGQSAAMIFEASSGTSGDEAASVAKISGLRTGSGATGDLLFHTTSSGTSTERVRIDSSGVLQISNATPTLQFTDTDNNYDATIQGLSGSLVLTADSGAEFGTESIQFKTGGSEVARFDASGNFLVNRTSVFTTAKMEIQSDAGDASTLALNSIDTDGSILELYKAGTSVGSIGAVASQLYIAGGDTGLQLNGTADQVRPCDGSGAARDAAIDLGDATRRFKDLYLSGRARAAGSTGSPAFAHVTDTDTGMNPDGSGNIQFTTQGSEAMRISGGKLLVGSTSAIFTNSVIQGVSALGPTIGAKQTAAAQSAGGFWNSASGDVALTSFFAGSGGTQIGSISGNSTSVSLLGSGGAGLTVTSTGSAGIGTSNPAQKLSLSGASGSARFSLERSNANTTGGIGSIQWNASDGHAVAGIIALGDGDDEGAHLTFNTTSAASDSDVYASTTEAVRITSAGRVGINRTSPNGLLHLQSASGSNSELYIQTSAGTDESRICFGDNSSSIAGQIQYIHNGNNMAFRTNGSEACRIDSSQNLLVGKTATNLDTAGIEIDGTNNRLFVTRAGTPVAINRLSSDGDAVQFYKDGTERGSIGVENDDLNIDGDTGIRFQFSSLMPRSSGSDADNSVSLGLSSHRFTTVFAVNGTINTSDRNEKQDIEELSDAEKRVAVAAKGLLRKYRWKSAVEEKGDDARIHFGIIAQDLQDAFTAEGLDAARYGMWCSDTWTDDDGNEQTRLGVRYSELLAFIISAI